MPDCDCRLRPGGWGSTRDSRTGAASGCQQFVKAWLIVHTQQTAKKAMTGGLSLSGTRHVIKVNERTGRFSPAVATRADSSKLCRGRALSNSTGSLAGCTTPAAVWRNFLTAFAVSRPGSYKGGNMSSTYNPGRVAGFLYLLLVVIAPFRLIYIPSTLIVS